MLQNDANKMYISYDIQSQKFIYRSDKNLGEPFCQTDNALYSTSREGCMYRSGSSVVLSKDCAGSMAQIQLSQSNPGYYKIINSNNCLRSNELSNTQDGASLYFDPECNDSRLQFTLVS